MVLLNPRKAASLAAAVVCAVFACVVTWQFVGPDAIGGRNASRSLALSEMQQLFGGDPIANTGCQFQTGCLVYNCGIQINEGACDAANSDFPGFLWRHSAVSILAIMC